MRRFKFKLETKLRLTVQEEKQTLWEYRTRQYEWQEQQKHLTALEQQLIDLWDYYRDIVVHQAGIHQLIAVQQFVPVIKERISNQRVKVNQAAELMQEAESAYMSKRVERKTLDALKDREHQQYMLEWLHEEQKVIDEIASTGAGRRNLTGSR
ncbi:MAG: flagellar export protein FliJ [Methylocystaceae bacterium]